MRALLLCPALVLCLSTCQPSLDHELSGVASPSSETLVAFDFGDLAEGRVHGTRALLEVDGSVVASVSMPDGPAALEGAATWSLAAGRDMHVAVAIVDQQRERWTRAVVVRGGVNEVVRLSVRASSAGRLELVSRSPVLVDQDCGATVDYVDTTRAQAWLARVGEQPVAALAAVLRDPQVLVLTPASPQASVVDTIGPLVAWRSLGSVAVVETGDEVRSPTTPTVAAATAPSVGTSAFTIAGQVVPSFMRYYSFCRCGRAVVDHTFQFTGADGRRLDGRTDRFGMVMVPHGGAGQIQYGPRQRKRTRSYSFVPGEPSSRLSVLAALQSTDPNDVLTALLDLRQEPLPAARDRLIALLAHGNPVVWRNAAMTLSFYPGAAIDTIPSLADGGFGDRDRERAMIISGAIRHPAAIASLAEVLSSGTAKERAVAAWGLGFIAHRRALPALLDAVADPDAQVRAEVALAIGRVGGSGAMEALETLLADLHTQVVARAQQSVAMLLM